MKKKLFPVFFFFETLDHHFAAKFGKPVDKEFAVAMVGFVQEAAGGVAFGVLFEPFAFFVLGFQTGFHRASYNCRDFADGKTAFLAGLFALV